MGFALLNGWKSNSDLDISVLDPSLSSAYKSPDEIPDKSFEIIVLAIKPNILNEVCEDIKNAGISFSFVISIAAGKTLENIEKVLGSDKAIIRTMPNTPAMIGQGITAAIQNKNIQPHQIDTTSSLLKNLGKLEWIEDEKLMDAVTAVSGSGPAYVFLLIEELAKAGISHGLPPELAMNLARQTVIGSAALAADQADTAETLRKNVTSPGGTTEAALKVLMADDGLGQLLDRAVDAATKRSRALSS